MEQAIKQIQTQTKVIVNTFTTKEGEILTALKTCKKAQDELVKTNNQNALACQKAFE